MNIAKDTVILLDVDGVINEPQQPITPEMHSKLVRLATHYQVYFVTGNGYCKTVDIINGPIGKFMGVFCNNADELRTMRGKLVWQDTYTPPLPYLRFPAMAANCSVEWRSPRFVNYSLIGRYATKEQRESHDASWRKYFIDFRMGGGLPEIEMVIGGSVSVDIYSKGADKSRAAKYINRIGKNFIFIGDKTDEGGNDYCVKKYCEDNPENICLTSFGTKHTMELLDKFLE